MRSVGQVVQRAQWSEPSGRPAVLFMSWSMVGGRAEEISAALGGRACVVHPRILRGSRRAPLRYAVALVVCASSLLRYRPCAVIATNPPVFPGVLGWVYSRVAGVPLLLDSHPTAFGAKQNRVAQRMMRVHRWLASRSAAVLVTTQEWVREVEDWGGTALVVHEAPPARELDPPGPPAGRPRVLFVAVFASDEPVEEVVEAARRRPGYDVVVTGDTARAPEGLVEASPPNVSFVGFLPQDRYLDLLAAADVVLALTTEPTSVMRAAYEAVWAGRPCVVSDWPVLRELFPEAVTTTNDAGAIAEALDAVMADHGTLRCKAGQARARQMERWESQLAAMRGVLG